MPDKMKWSGVKPKQYTLQVANKFGGLKLDYLISKGKNEGLTTPADGLQPPLMPVVILDFNR